MATKTPNDCPTSCGGCVCRMLGKVGVCRSTLITLALVPFAWDGVLWFADAVRSRFAVHGLGAGTGRFTVRGSRTRGGG